MLEAAILFPIILLISASLIFIILFLYTSTAIKVNLDIETLKKSGNLSGVCMTEEKNIEYQIKRTGLYQVVEMHQEKVDTGLGLLTSITKQKESSEYSIHDEADILRKASILEDWLP